MKRVEKLAIILIILFFINILAGYPLQLIITRGFGIVWLNDYRESIQIISIIRGILISVVNIAIATWLFTDARANSLKKWVWACLGLFYGIYAVILYLLYRLTLELKRSKDGSRV